MIRYPKLPQKNGNVVTVEILDENYLPLRTRGFGDAGEATRWLLDYLYTHHGVHFEIFLIYEDYLRIQKARRRWKKFGEGILKWIRKLRRRRG